LGSVAIVLIAQGARKPPSHMSKTPLLGRDKSRNATKEYPEEKQGPSSSIPTSIFNLVKNVVGAGVLSLPYGVAAGTGLVPAMILCAILGGFSAYTFHLVGRDCYRTNQFNFHNLGERTKGESFARILDVAVTFKTSFTCLAYSIVIADSFSDIFKSLGLPGMITNRTTVLLGFTICILRPLCLLKSLDALKPTSILGSIGMVYVTCFMIFRYSDGSYTPGGDYFDTLPPQLQPNTSEELNMWDVNIKTLVLVCTLSTGFIAHYNAPRFYEALEKRSPDRFGVVVGVSFSVAIVMFLLAMVSGYLTFRSKCQGLILNNYSTDDPLATIARIAVGGAIVFSYPFAFTGFRDGTMALMGVNSEDPVRWNFITNALIVLVTLTALVVTDVGFVNSFGGAVFGACIIYIFPVLLFLFTDNSKDNILELLFAKFLLVLGIALGFLGSIIACVKQFAPEML